MKRPKISLKMGILTIIVLCWLVPIAIVVSVSGVLLSVSYRNSARQEIDAGAENALRQIQLRLEDAVSDSKAVSYDGEVRSAYRSYLQTEDSAGLYRAVNDYLNQNFSREELYKAVFIGFWDREVKADAYVLSSGTTGYPLLAQCRRMTPEILQAMSAADTEIRFLMLDGQLYMARNLLDSRFIPYASVVMLLDPEILFQSLDAVNRVSQMQLRLDDCGFRLGEAGTLEPVEEAAIRGDTHFSVQAEGHDFSVTATLETYDLWAESPWLRWAVAAVAAMVLPLLLVMVWLFYHHVSQPMRTLAQAYSQVREGERGYQIGQRPPNREFDRLYGQFNDMSVELKNQFERSYLEQQATQKAQIKALQSQINPHFLNNTLEIINWEARLAGNDRVSAMIEALSTMLGATLDRGGRSQIPLSEELGYVDAYLYIIRKRLGDGFLARKEIDGEILEQKIPRLILQPLVENAVEHDISARHGGALTVRAYRREEKMVLEVEHDGSMTPEDRENIRRLLSDSADCESQVGLRNVSRRLRLLYAEEGSLTVEEIRPGTILARVSFPAE